MGHPRLNIVTSPITAFLTTFPSIPTDHRGCCASWGVPRNCLELCRGGSVSRSCALQHARRALACFRDSGARLPGPPRNLKAHAAPTKNSVLLR